MCDLSQRELSSASKMFGRIHGAICVQTGRKKAPSNATHELLNLMTITRMATYKRKAHYRISLIVIAFIARQRQLISWFCHKKTSVQGFASMGKIAVICMRLYPSTRWQYRMIRYYQRNACSRCTWNTRRRIDENVARIRIKAELFSRGMRRRMLEISKALFFATIDSR